MLWCNRGLIINPYHVALCLSPKKFKKELKRLGVTEKLNFIKSPQSNATTWFLESGAGKQVVIVCLRDQEKYDLVEVFGLLVHEAVHIWQAVKDDMGERSPSSEFEAYSVQAVAQQLMWAYRELTK